MKKNWFLILLAVIAIIIAIVIIITHKEKKFNHFDFPNTVLVTNHTNYEHADTLAMVILNKIFSYDTIEVNIYYMPTDIGNDEIQVQAFIKKNPYVKHNYLLFVKRTDLAISIDKIISHEMIHVKQLESGILVQVDTDKYIYDGKEFQFSKVSYNKRPQEIDAFRNENKVLSKLNNLLYTK